MEIMKCKNCIYCEIVDTVSRKFRYCKHPAIKGDNFITFEVCTWSDDVALKTSPHWCPLRAETINEVLKKHDKAM